MGRVSDLRHLSLLDALASLDFTLVSKSVSGQSFGFEAFKPVYMRQKTWDHDQGSMIMSSCHHVILSEYQYLSSVHAQTKNDSRQEDKPLKGEVRQNIFIGSKFLFDPN